MNTRKIQYFLISIGIFCLVISLTITPDFIKGSLSSFYQSNQISIDQVHIFQIKLAAMGCLYLLLAIGFYLNQNSFRLLQEKLNNLPLKSIFIGIVIIFCIFPLFVNFLVFDPPKMTQDAAVFEHAGWFMTQGAKPYLDFWDPKPPLVFETTLLLAFFAQGNVYLIHLFSVLLTSCAIIGILLLTESINFHLTENRLASVLGALVLLTVPGFYTLASRGFHPKYLMILCGLAAIYLQIKKRKPFLSGALAAASTTFWLPGGVFLLITLGLSVQKTRYKVLLSTILGITITGLLILVPIFIWGVFEPMLVEVIFVPFTVSETQTVMDRIIRLISDLGIWGLLPVVLGLIGIFIPLKDQQSYKTNWWIIAGGVWFGFQILLIDYDHFPDMFVFLLFCSLGMCFFLDWTIVQKKSSPILILAALLILIPVLFKGFNWGFQEIVFKPDRISLAAQEDRPEGYDEAPEIVRIFWNKELPEKCHYRLSPMEVQWMEISGQTGNEQVCGQIDIIDWWFDR